MQEARYFGLQSLVRRFHPSAMADHQLGAANVDIRDTEAVIRGLFAQCRGDPRIADSHVLLLRVFNDGDGQVLNSRVLFIVAYRGTHMLWGSSFHFHTSPPY